MRTIFTVGTALALVMVSLGANEVQESRIDLEVRKATIPTIEKRIAERETQVVEIANDILKLHQRLDGKLDRIVTRLSGIKDSAGSGYRVSKLKVEAIGQLQTTIETFRTKRAALVADLRGGKSGLPPEIVGAEVNHLDSHVEKHIAQMLELSKSFTQDDDVEKYETVGGGRYYDSGFGWYEESVGISDAWRQNRRDRSMDKKQRGEVIVALKESIDYCESRISSLRDALEKPELSTAERGVIQQELDPHLGMLETRRSQMDGLLVMNKPETVEVSRDVARDLEDAIRDLVDDLQRDLRLIVLKHSQLSREQSKFHALQENLEARKTWIVEYEYSQKN